MTAPEEPPVATGSSTVDEPAEPVAATKAPGKRSFVRELPFLIIVALVLALLIKTFLVQAFYIPSASMEPTLMGGPHASGAPGPGNPAEPYDRILVNKLVYRFRDPHRGEIVVFKKPSYWTDLPSAPPTTGLLHAVQSAESAIGIPVSTTEDIVKRVIGVPGDDVRCTLVHGDPNSSVLTVNGHRLSEPYIYPGSPECSYGGHGFNVVVPKGHLWVMGDNRNNSSDSRANMDNPEHGTIPIDNVIGRAFVVIWPHQDWRGLSVPATFGQPGLGAAAGAAATSPAALGFAGALPLTLLRRRRNRRRARRSGRP